MSVLAAALLAALLVTAVVLLTGPTPVLISSGLAVATVSPLVFIGWQALRPTDGKRSHPVLVSVISGFGCVMVMAGIYRFGDQHQWVLAAALVALCIWMAWQRWYWRDKLRRRP